MIMHTSEQPVRYCKGILSTRQRGAAVECENCGLVGMCRVAGLGSHDTVTLERLVTRRQQVASGKRLIAPNGSVGNIFAVKSGSFKAFTTLADGTEKIVDFHFPGELIGLDAIATGNYSVTVEAQESSSVCRLNLADIHLLGNRLLEFQQHLVKALSARTRQEQWIPLMLGAKNAEQRVAVFLISLATRFTTRGLAGTAFRLPMSRTAIANYLGLAVETVSRTFQQFQRMGLLEVHGRRLLLRDTRQLHAIGGLSPASQS